MVVVVQLGEFEGDLIVFNRYMQVAKAEIGGKTMWVFHDFLHHRHETFESLEDAVKHVLETLYPRDVRFATAYIIQDVVLFKYEYRAGDRWKRNTILFTNKIDG